VPFTIESPTRKLISSIAARLMYWSSAMPALRSSLSVT
jgi:hypothetical protein